ncbi:MAG: MarR family transcriptional regulator [Clostridia bacterium]|nr:MarR family transcriptional regulator [Clostridia bacterium]
MNEEALKLDHQLCFPLYACARRVVGFYTPYLKPLGLTYTQYIAFLALWETPEMTVKELGRRLMLDSGTLTPMLKKLEENGYLVRSRSREDERMVTVTLTERGRQLKEQVKGIPGSVGSCMPLDAQEAVTLYQLLYKVLRQASDPD